MSLELCLQRIQASRRLTTGGPPSPLATSDDDPADPEGSLPLLDDALPDGGDDAPVEELLPAEALDAGGDQDDEEEDHREEEALLGELPPLDDDLQEEPESEPLPPLLLPPLDDEAPSALDDVPPPPLLGFEDEEGIEDEEGTEDEEPSVPGDLLH